MSEKRHCPGCTRHAGYKVAHTARGHREFTGACPQVRAEITRRKKRIAAKA